MPVVARQQAGANAPAPSPEAAPTDIPTAPVPSPSRGHARRTALLGVGAVMVLVVAVAVGVTVAHLAAPDPPAAMVRVELEPADAPSPDGFTPSVANTPATSATTTAPTTTAAGPAATEASTVRVKATPGGQPGLYAADPKISACDKAKLKAALTADPGVARVWAQLMGVDRKAINTTIDQLTPVVLQRDTAVTNSRYATKTRRGTTYQAILQAGTPVLVDAAGTPRVKCTCGNPLTPPALTPTATIASGERGDTWKGFDPRAVVTVTPSATPLTQLPVTNSATGARFDLPLAGATTAGATTKLDGLLLSNSSGVHVIDATGKVLATLVHHKVGKVFDDGAGGLIYTDLPDDFQYTPPTSAAQATIWHLAAGASTPKPLASSASVTNGWTALQGAGRVGGQTFVAYLELTQGTAADGVAQVAGDLVLQDLESGAKTTVEPGAVVRRGSGDDAQSTAYIGEVSFNGGLFAVHLSRSDPGGSTDTWGLFGPGLVPGPEACESAEVSDDESLAAVPDCPYGGRLSSGTSVADVVSSESGESYAGVAVSDLRGRTSPRVIDVAIGGGPSEEASPDFTFDVLDDRMVTSWGWDDPVDLDSWPTTLIDLSSGTSTEIPVAGFIQFLRAPLVRPSSSPTTTSVRPPP